MHCDNGKKCRVKKGMRSVFRRWSAGMHRSISHVAPAPLLSAPAALRAWAGARSSRKNHRQRVAGVWGSSALRQAGGLCEFDQHLSIFDFLCVSASFENRVIEYVPRNAIYYLFVRKCCCQHLRLFQHLHIGETIVGRHTHEIQKARTTS